MAYQHRQIKLLHIKLCREIARRSSQLQQSPWSVMLPSQEAIVHNSAYNCRCIRIAIFICPIAIAYSMGQIIKSVYVCLSVCRHSHGRISLSIFTKFDTEV